MDADSSCIELFNADSLVHQWLDALKENMKEQENLVSATDEFYMPFVAIPVPVVHAMFKVSEYLQLSATTKFMAIHLYDKFMCNYFWEIYKSESPSASSWPEVYRKISSQSKLYVMSCLQIASKMDSYSKSLTIPQVINVLRCIDQRAEYSHGAIFSSEFKVFKTVGYKMPLCTPLHCVEVLLAATGVKITPCIYNVCMRLLDLSYLQHERLYSHIHTLLQGHKANSEREKRELARLKSNCLFLSAAVVLCATFFLFSEEEMIKHVAIKLAELVDIKYADIWDVANVLLIMSIRE